MHNPSVLLKPVEILMKVKDLAELPALKSA